MTGKPPAEGNPEYLPASRSGRRPKKAADCCTGHRRANFVTGKAREGGGLAEPAVDRAQRSRGRKAPARPATQDRGGVYRSFGTPEELRSWFARHAGRESALWIRFFKVGSGRASVTYPQALEEALACGWIDGVRKRLDQESYLQRFTPRRPGSVWSTVNIRKAEALIAAGRMTPAGLAAFERRDASAAARSSYQNRPVDLPPQYRAALKRNATAWAFWQEQPPGYRRMATWYVFSAKRDETRARRLAALIERLARRERFEIGTPPPAGEGRRKRR